MTLTQPHQKIALVFCIPIHMCAGVVLSMEPVAHLVTAMCVCMKYDRAHRSGKVDSASMPKFVVERGRTVQP